MKRAWAGPRPGDGRGVSATVVAAGVALWLLAVDNLSFWRTFTGAQTWSPTAVGASVALGAVLWLTAVALLRLMGPPRVAKPLWALLLMVSALAAHFVDGWNVLLDKAMMRNVLQTDAREAAELLTAPMVLDVLVRGALPAALVLLIPLRAAPRWDFLKPALMLALLAAMALAAALATFYPLYASTFRNHRELRLQLVPSNYLGALYGVLKPRRTAAFASVAPDAHRPAAGGRPLVLVLVVGETARADNFSLGSYERPTNAALHGRPLVYFSGVTSCGTDTATSLPCMFSDLGAQRFTPEAALARENVLDVLQRTGVQVRWVENNSGCKGVCDRVPTTTVQQATGCRPGECFDEKLLQVLEPQLNATTGDAVIVLHQQGSHGPSYFKRHPEAARFLPACGTARLQDCDRQAVVNSYDNTIDYTSQVLARTIDQLAGRADGRDVAMLYVSDHGESLGERGVYLHGMPRWLAPHEQSHVPMLLWMDVGARARLAPDSECTRSMATQSLSHDNLFHTLLGMYGVRTHAYRQELDVLAPIRGELPCPKPLPPVSAGPQILL